MTDQIASDDHLHRERPHLCEVFADVDLRTVSCLQCGSTIGSALRISPRPVILPRLDGDSAYVIVQRATYEVAAALIASAGDLAMERHYAAQKPGTDKHEPEPVPEPEVDGGSRRG